MVPLYFGHLYKYTRQNMSPSHSKIMSADDAAASEQWVAATCQRYGVKAKKVKGGYSMPDDRRVYATAEAAMEAFVRFPRALPCEHCLKKVKGCHYLAHTGFHGDCSMTWCQDCESLTLRSRMRQHKSRDCPRFHCKTCKGHHEYPEDVVAAEARTLFRRMHADSHVEKAKLPADDQECTPGSRFAALQESDTAAA